MNLELCTQVSGHIKIEAVRPNGEVRELTPWFPNLITDVGMNLLGTDANLWWAGVGTGTAAPANGNTSLGAEVSRGGSLKTATGGIAGTDPNLYGWRSNTFEFPVGAAAGNLTEVGFFVQSSLFSRALIRDGNGDPTTVTVLSDEILRVTYELRQYAPVDDVPFSFTIDGVPTTGFVRAANLADTNAWGNPFSSRGGFMSSNAYEGEAGLRTAFSPQGAYIASGTVTASAYVPNSYSRARSFSYSLSSSGTFRTIHLTGSGYGAYFIQFNPGLAKTTSKTIQGTVVLSWARRS